MTSQETRAKDFAALHVPGTPVILFNAWDAGSAKAVAEAGARAIATGSWSVAAANGFADGETVPLDLVLANLGRIVAAVDLPVTLDFERGYGASPGDVERSVARAISAGAIGFNIEDGLGGADIRPAREACERLAAVRRAAETSGVPAFVNARTDLFLVSDPAAHAGLVDAAIERGKVYADAGADGFFVPGLVDVDLIGRITEASRLPVNVMMSPSSPSLDTLARAGIGRASYGPGPYRLAMQALAKAAAEIYGKARA